MGLRKFNRGVKNPLKHSRIQYLTCFCGSNKEVQYCCGVYRRITRESLNRLLSFSKQMGFTHKFEIWKAVVKYNELINHDHGLKEKESDHEHTGN